MNKEIELCRKPFVLLIESRRVLIVLPIAYPPFGYGIFGGGYCRENGHDSIDITLHYAHIFPPAQKDMAEKLNMERVG